MRHKTLFTVSGIVLLLYGLLWLLIPAAGLSLFGLDVDVFDESSIIARYWGSAFLGVAVITFFARKGQSDSIAVRAILFGGFVMALTGLVAALIDAFWGSTNDLIWTSVAIYVVFSIWYGYLAFRKTG